MKIGVEGRGLLEIHLSIFSRLGSNFKLFLAKNVLLLKIKIITIRAPLMDISSNFFFVGNGHFTLQEFWKSILEIGIRRYLKLTFE